MKNQNITQKKLKTGFPFTCYGDSIALCGQPQAGDLEEFKKESWTNVLNLRTPQEMDMLEFNMSKICQTLALNYNHIPVIVKGDISKEALEEVHTLLSNADKKFVIHCASGARSVIALIAHFIFLNGYKTSELPSLAEELGLYQLKMLNRLFQIMNINL